MEDLIEHAASLGLCIGWQDLGRCTAVLHSAGLILVNPQRATPVQRMAVAHECGHWAYAHDWTAAHDRPRDERQADTYASRLLITRDSYAAAERCVGSYPGAIAREFDVTARLVELWREDYLRRVGVIRVAV